MLFFFFFFLFSSKICAIVKDQYQNFGRSSNTCRAVLQASALKLSEFRFLVVVVLQRLGY